MEFLIHQVERDAETARISGIVSQGEIPVGAAFVSLREASGATSPISLRVTRIVTYRHVVDQLPKGMSGELHVSGDGLDRLAHRGALIG